MNARIELQRHSNQNLLSLNNEICLALFMSDTLLYSRNVQDHLLRSLQLIREMQRLATTETFVRHAHKQTLIVS